MKNMFQNKRVVGIVLVVSLLVNVYLFNELYKANQIDKVAASNNFMKWETRYQMFTGSLGRILEDVNDEKSYNGMLESAEFIRVFQTVPMNNYYGSKNMKELGSSLLVLTAQITYVVEESFYLNNYDDLTEGQLNNLKEFHNNLDLLSKQFNNMFEEVRKSKLNFKEYQVELSLLMEDAIESNKNIFPKLNGINTEVRRQSTLTLKKDIVKDYT